MMMWYLMRSAAIIRHRIVWQAFEASNPARWPGHMAVIRAVYGY